MKHVWLTNSRAHGYSLLELLVALTTGLLVITMIIMFYLSNKQTQRAQEALARLQENGRFVVDIIGRELRMAGFVGCNSRNSDLIIYDRANGYPDAYGDLLFDRVVRGFDDGAGWVSNNLSGVVRTTGSDVLSLVHGANGGADTASTMASINAPITTRFAYQDLQVGDVAIITDCLEGDIFDVQAVSPNGAPTQFNPGTPLSRPYAVHSHVMRMEVVHFFIGQTPSMTLPALYWQSYQSPPQKLLDGVENMQLRFGVDTDDDSYADEYRDASAVTDWGQVASVMITLNLASVQQNVSEDTTSPDRRQRKAFSKTISLRNRLS